MRVCKVKYCDSIHYGLGFCVKHHRRFVYTGTWRKKIKYGYLCSQLKCTKKILSSGLCSAHHAAMKKGRPLDSVGKHLHGMSKHYTYQIWTLMKYRCLNKNNKSYKHYGGRGISIYEPWINDYKSFMSWILDNLGEKPEGNSIDRIDNNGNYEPGNLRWSDRSTQMFNRRISRNNSSGVSGVTILNNKKWVARISFRNKKIQIGTYKTKEEAVLARKKAELRYYGKII